MKKTVFCVLSFALTFLQLSATTKHNSKTSYTNNVQSGVIVHAADITELRTAANALRQSAGLAPFTFTDANLTGHSIRD